MKHDNCSPRDRLARRGWLLWGTAFAVVIAFATLVPLLYLPLSRLLQTDAQFAQESYLATVGLSGLVAVFCLYTALKQRELETIRLQIEAAGVREGRRPHASLRAVGAVPALRDPEPAAAARRHPRDHRAPGGRHA